MTRAWRRSVGKQMTEMLKGTLEGIVLAILALAPAYGYEITVRLRDRGLADIAEGTVYAVLIRIEQRGLEKMTTSALHLAARRLIANIYF